MNEILTESLSRRSARTSDQFIYIGGVKPLTKLLDKASF